MPEPRTRVLIVEDDAAFRAALASAVMRVAQFELLGAGADLADGLALMQRLRPDLLLVDLQLPGGSGLTLIGAAAQALPQADIVVITTLGEDETVMAALAAGAVGYLLKQGSPTHLVAQLETLREGGAPLSPLIARKLLRQLPQRPQAPNPADAVTLTAREIEILQAIAMGYRFDEIAAQLSLSVNTVTTHVKRCYRKLQVHSKTQAVHQARRLGLLT